jgi:hypothetical protein
MDIQNIGTAVIETGKSVVAGEYTTVRFVYTAGVPIDDTGCIRLLFRQVSDFGIPQFDDPAAENYCRVLTNGDCALIPWWDEKGYLRPWGKCIYIRIKKGFLNSGEKITVILGDTSQGSSGWRMNSFREHHIAFRTQVDPFATYNFKELPNPPFIKTIAGEPAQAVCTAPTSIRPDQPFDYHLRIEDKWGNPAREPLKFKHEGFSKIGIQSIQAVDTTTGLKAQSNPIEVKDRFVLRKFWADFHGQTGETVGSNTIEDYFEFAEKYSMLDIIAHQGNDFQVKDEFWLKINALSEQYNKPGKIITFPGYEWSGNTPVGGDRNVFYAEEGGIIARSHFDLLPGETSKYPMAVTVGDMFKRLSKDKKPFVFAHVGGRYADVSMHDEDLEVAMEIHSAWGTFEWIVEDAFKQGYRIGICANSDGHKTRPGASYPGPGKFGSLGGLTCVLAEKLDRGSVYEAIKKRHFYASTGNRSILDVSVKTSLAKSAIMGDVIEMTQGETATLVVKASGTAPLEKVDIRNGLETIAEYYPFSEEACGKKIKIIWSGAELKGRNRLASWDGSLRISGNKIKNYTPINFWNKSKPPKQIGETNLEWMSNTTGGVSGFIIELENRNTGNIEIHTFQGEMNCEISAITRSPKKKEFGGIRKQIAIHRLPDDNQKMEVEFKADIKEIRKGDNPIYVRISQEDGHFAWSSPIYLNKLSSSQHRF